MPYAQRISRFVVENLHFPVGCQVLLRKMCFDLFFVSFVFFFPFPVSL